jgi:hypothetical protein
MPLPEMKMLIDQHHRISKEKSRTEVSYLRRSAKESVKA